jgi:hypothetical protein
MGMAPTTTPIATFTQIGTSVTQGGAADLRSERDYD